MAGAVVAMLLGASACAAVVPGAAEPTPTSTPGPTDFSLAPRPFDLRLDGVDPCAILTEQQLTELGFDGEVLPSESNSSLFGRGPACSFRGFEPRAVSMSFVVASEKGIETLVQDGVTDELTAITVGGFPAVLARPTNPAFCSVDVDVAPGQLLDVHFADGGRKPPIPQDQLCRDAVVVAEAAVASLRAP